MELQKETSKVKNQEKLLEQKQGCERIVQDCYQHLNYFTVSFYFEFCILKTKSA